MNSGYKKHEEEEEVEKNKRRKEDFRLQTKPQSSISQIKKIWLQTWKERNSGIKKGKERFRKRNLISLNQFRDNYKLCPKTLV